MSCNRAVADRMVVLRKHRVTPATAQDIEDSVMMESNNEVIPKNQLESFKSFVRELAEVEYETPREFQLAYIKTRKKMHCGIKITPRKLQMIYVYRKLVEAGELSDSLNFRRFLIAKSIRSSSGVLVITVFTSPYPKFGGKTQRFSCKHNCYYCPNEPGLPRSYLSKEPGVARGKRHSWDPVDQFYARGWEYSLNGHPIDKIELLVLGGTWSEYPHEYQEEFLRDIFWSANTFFDSFPKRNRCSLYDEQKINETARVKIIGVTLETRPDSVDVDEVSRFRRYGCTRDAIRAVRLLKEAGLKVDFHLMPDLPGSTPDKDLAMFDRILNQPDLQADQWKIYPCQTVPWTIIEKWYKDGSYVPYSDETLLELIMQVKTKVHPWIRLNRVIRDIPNVYVCFIFFSISNLFFFVRNF
eukprot:GSMAST32.ASY1.ANO1.1927.1 assembled CDS